MNDKSFSKLTKSVWLNTHQFAKLKLLKHKSSHFDELYESIRSDIMLLRKVGLQLLQRFGVVYCNEESIQINLQECFLLISDLSADWEHFMLDKALEMSEQKRPIIDRKTYFEWTSEMLRDKKIQSIQNEPFQNEIILSTLLVYASVTESINGYNEITDFINNHLPWDSDNITVDEGPHEVLELPNNNQTQPQTLFDIWMPDKNGSKLYYNEVINFLQIEYALILSPFVTEIQGRLHWNKVPQKGWVQYLAAFTYTCIKNKWISNDHSANKLKKVLQATFLIPDFSNSPLKSLMANPPDEKYCIPFKNIRLTSK